MDPSIKGTWECLFPFFTQQQRQPTTTKTISKQIANDTKNIAIAAATATATATTTTTTAPETFFYP